MAMEANGGRGSIPFRLLTTEQGGYDTTIRNSNYGFADRPVAGGFVDELDLTGTRGVRIVGWTRGADDAALSGLACHLPRP